MSDPNVLHRLRVWHPKRRVLLIASEADESVAVGQPCRGVAVVLRQPLGADEADRTVRSLLSAGP
jgi:xanthine/CO dehydrogenase XdhC/CoxF family maturation factor